MAQFYFQEIITINEIFYLDINGFKGPNTPGKDVFGILIQRDDVNSNTLRMGSHNCLPGKTIQVALREAYK